MVISICSVVWALFSLEACNLSAGRGATHCGVRSVLVGLWLFARRSVWVACEMIPGTRMG